MLLFPLYLVPLFALPKLAFAFSFDLTSVPTQCGQLHVNITEGSGKPPYSVLVVPFGASPVTPERRTILSHTFNGSSTSFQMAYPANSGFVIALGDADGIGTGGTSIPTNVASSSDTSCLPNNVSIEYSFQVLPSNAIDQCQPVTLAWGSRTQGDVTIQLVIPGGISSTIPQPSLQHGLQGNTTGFSWTPDIPVGTNMILVAGDSRGIGTGGSAGFSVGNNPNGDSSCINGNSPSSTPGTAAGAIETGGSTPAPNNNNNSGSSTNVGAIVGGVIAGIAITLIAALITFFCVRKRRQNQLRRRRQSLDLLPDTEQATEMYRPDPFIVPSAITANSSRHARTASEFSDGSDHEGGAGAGAGGAGGMTVAGLRPSMSDAGGRRYSTISTTDASETTNSNYLGVMRSGGGFGAGSSVTSSSRKSPAPPTFRAVNYVQHEDAGQLRTHDDGDGDGSEEGREEEPETVELPPNYDAIRR